MDAAVCFPELRRFVAVDSRLFLDVDSTVLSRAVIPTEGRFIFCLVDVGWASKTAVSCRVGGKYEERAESEPSISGRVSFSAF